MIEIKRIDSVSELLRWRIEVINHVFGVEPAATLIKSNREYYERHIPDGSHLAFIATWKGEEAGSGSICLSDELPSPDNPSGRCAYLMNIYVRDAFREHGIGHAIVSRLIEEAEKLNCGKIYLETTEEGRSLYTSMGFCDLPDMMKLWKK